MKLFFNLKTISLSSQFSSKLATAHSASPDFIFSTDGSRCRRTRLTSHRGHHMMLNKQKIIFPHIKRNRLSLSFHPPRRRSRVTFAIAHLRRRFQGTLGFTFFSVFLKCPENKVGNFKGFDLLESDSKETSRLTLLDIFLLG